MRSIAKSWGLWLFRKPKQAAIAADPLGAGAKGPSAVLAAAGAGGTTAGRTLVAPEPGAPLPPRP